MNIQNLTILANHLDHVPQPAFAMDSFARDEHGDRLDPPAHECATVACAVGHGPGAGLPVGDAQSWGEYAIDTFGLLPGSPEFSWCFSGGWYWRDDTPAGAAKRIRHLIYHGLPADADDQLEGHAPYIFGAVH